ncbi:MAG: LemA family protein [Desulfobacterales bacterium]|nr:LemA family protein [Desulfobacterales bacterium]
MTGHKLQLFGFCSVLTAIILFCVLAGGYTSFWRSKNRIEASKSLLTDACQKRLDLLPELIEISRKSKTQTSGSKMDRTAQKAAKVLQLVSLQETPLENNLIKEFEISQSNLTFQIREVFAQLETSLDKNHSKQFSDLKEPFFAAQNNLFVTGNRYNDEAKYFNARKEAFWTSFIAKLFGFNKLYYIEISKDLFLPAKATFAKNSS